MDAILPAAARALTDGPLRAALEDTRSRFMARNLQRCPYLAVHLETDASGRRVSLVANYTTSRDERNWKRVEVRLPAFADLEDDEVIERLEACFAQLEAGIDAARLARLFAPHSTAHRQRQSEPW